MKGSQCCLETETHSLLLQQPLCFLSPSHSGMMSSRLLIRRPSQPLWRTAKIRPSWLVEEVDTGEGNSDDEWRKACECGDRKGRWRASVTIAEKGLG